MTNNIDRAAEVIGKAISQRDMAGRPDMAEGIGVHLAVALADAGLLAPDLPELQTFPSGEREWSTLDGFVNLDTEGAITIAYNELDEDDLAAGAEIECGALVFTRISEARAFALSLLAAANHAEKENRE